MANAISTRWFQVCCRAIVLLLALLTGVQVVRHLLPAVSGHWWVAEPAISCLPGIVSLHGINQAGLISPDSTYRFELMAGIRYDGKPCMWCPSGRQKVHAELQHIRARVSWSDKNFRGEIPDSHTLASQNL